MDLPKVSPRSNPFLPPQPPMPEVPVGARLLHFANRWLQITSDAWVHSLVTKGLTFHFEKRPPLSRVPIDLVSPHPQLPDSILGLLEKQAVERVHDPCSPGFYSRLFLVQKKSGSWRPVIDLKVFNTFLVKPTFKMETPAFIRRSIKPMHWGVSLDLEDAFFHVPIHPNYRKYLRFFFRGQVYQFRAMPFGLATAPQVFTKLMAAEWRTPPNTRDSTASVFRRLALTPARSSTASAEPRVLLEGAPLFRTPSQCSQVRPHSLSGFHIRGNEFSDPHQSGQGLAATCIRPPFEGQMGAVPISYHSSRFPLAQRYPELCSRLRAVGTSLPTSSSALSLSLLEMVSRQSANTDSHPPSLVPHLQWWLDEETLLAGVPLLPPQPSLHLITDASMEGWGAHLEPRSLTLSGLWSPQESHLHINNLEMRAVFLAVSQFQSHLRDSCVMVSTDNTSVVAYIQKQGGTHSHSLYLETRNLLVLCKSLNVSLLSKHIPGRLNALADGLSRKHQLLPSEWTLHQEVANQIFLTFGYPLVDLFATRDNHRLPLYVSPVYEPAAWAVDALSFDWDQLDAYAYPPPILIPQILGKISVSSCQILLIAPWWPRRSWFNDLLGLLCDFPRELPHRSDLLSQRGRLHMDPDMFHLHVWPLSSNPCRRNAFLSGLQLSLPLQGESPPEQSMMLAGNSSLIGVFEGKLIPSIPLLDA